MGVIPKADIPYGDLSLARASDIVLIDSMRDMVSTYLCSVELVTLYLMICFLFGVCKIWLKSDVFSNLSI